MGNNTQPLSDTIQLTDLITKQLLDKWNISIPTILKTSKLSTLAVDPVVCRRYRYDFYGLLLFLRIPVEYHYPHLIANGYTSPTAFKGDIYDIALLDISVLSKYLSAFIR